MDILKHITDWTNSFLESTLFLVDIEQKAGSSKISVYIDGDEGINIESCRKLSRHLSEKLDELDYGDKAYYLEVSSPGVDRPLKISRQYKKNIGRELLIKLISQTELQGRLKEVTDSGIILELKDNKKTSKSITTEKSIAFNDIETAIVQVSFK